MANKQLFVNNAATTLSGGITNVATSIAVAAGTGALFPSPSGGDWFLVTLWDGVAAYEVVKCTTRSTDTLTVERAQEGTTGIAFSSGASVLGNATKGTFEQMVQRTGDLDSLTAGTATVANGLKSATTTVVVSAATAPTNGQVLTASSSTVASWVTPSSSGFMTQLVTDSTDIALANRASTHSAVGSTFVVNIPASGFIRLGSMAGKFLNDATAGAHGLAIGIRISSGNYWFGRYLNNSAAEVTSYSTLSTTSAGYTSFFGSTPADTISSATDPWHPVLDVSAAGVPTGAQTVQLIAAYVTNAVTIKGTDLQFRAVLEFLG